MKEITLDEAYHMWHENASDRIFFGSFKAFCDYLQRRRYVIV